MRYKVYYYEDSVPGHAQPEYQGTFRTEKDAKGAAREALTSPLCALRWNMGWAERKGKYASNSN